jgi:G:T-mismatch repair DNA endonuclease (very short patch repair protein)
MGSKWSEDKLKNHVGTLGYHHTEETKRKMMESNLGQKRSEEFRAKMREASKGNTSHLGHKLTPEQRARVAEGTRKAMATKEMHDKLSKSHIGLKQSDATVEKRMEKLVKVIHKSPTKPEIKVGELLQNICPGLYEYVGNGHIRIGKKRPDFINVAHTKVILEHGDYWHLGRKRVKTPTLTRQQVEENDTQHYKKFGCDLLIIWEHELKPSHIEATINKVKEFNER